MNSTQYLIILITAVVCFGIYVLAEILRLRKRENAGMRKLQRKAEKRMGGSTEYDESTRRALGAALNGDNRIPYSQLSAESSRKIAMAHLPMDAQKRLQEEIRTRLEGGDGA